MVVKLNSFRAIKDTYRRNKIGKAGKVHLKSVFVKWKNGKAEKLRKNKLKYLFTDNAFKFSLNNCHNPIKQFLLFIS